MRLELDLGSNGSVVFEDYYDTEYVEVSVEDANDSSNITLGLVEGEGIKRLGKS